MKNLRLSIMLLFSALSCHAQEIIEDQAIRYQQERMVFKQWDEDKFVPKPGFLGLNPLYWVTWALHPNYPDHDLRPLSIFGPQSQRLSLTLALENTTNAYKKESDTLARTALGAAVNYDPSFADLDPLWQLYYADQFKPLIEQRGEELLSGESEQVSTFLIRSGLLSWYLQESDVLRQRLDTSRKVTLDRGSRIIGYQRMLDEYRKLQSTWDAARQRAKLYLNLNSAKKKINNAASGLSQAPRSDKQIADEILSKSKL